MHFIFDYSYLPRSRSKIRLCETFASPVIWFAKLARCIYKERERGVPPSKRVKSDAFTGLQETYVDTIDVVPSNFSITREREKERQDRSTIVRFDTLPLNRSTFTFHDAMSSRTCNARCTSSSDVKIFIRTAATGCKIIT